MTKNIKLGITKDFRTIFIGDLDEEKGVLKKAYKMLHNVIGGGTKVQFGMIDPFLPYSAMDAMGNADSIPEIPKSFFFAWKEPREEIRQSYLEITSGLVIPSSRPDGKGGKIVTAQCSEVIKFSDIKKKSR